MTKILRLRNDYMCVLVLSVSDLVLTCYRQTGTSNKTGPIEHVDTLFLEPEIALKGEHLIFLIPFKQI